MENYKLDVTENTPLVDLNFENHKLRFEGDSRPEDVQKFFHPILDWLDDYSEHIASLGTEVEISCDFQFEYFNSSSAKYVMDIVTQLGTINSSSDKVKLNINWHYEEMDEDMLEAGEEFEEMVNIPFNFVMVED